ncbi:OmpH family outer membrane protein [Pontibacter sp. G13]|uniref:OmpH family outer membrane protein n=1 Tax=Pontibacter sp. G13 TaxID=3074898 RepID=UPI002889B1C7|nr:OmpH family outer membrane protein [Pontibacter sp. G13]WNJ16487.1 OmpH family outer membrane protein [Pontibacter sp. G13]
MRLKALIAFLLVGLGCATPNFSQAQVKIGYVNMEAVLVYMPETKSMNQQLQTMQGKLAEDLQTRQVYLQTKAQDYQAAMQSPNPPSDSERQALEKELQELDAEIRKKAAESDEKLMAKRADLMAPISEKIQRELKALAEAEGYSHILNTTDGSGMSIVLHGPEEDELTLKLMTRLGIKIPENQ